MMMTKSVFLLASGLLLTIGTGWMTRTIAAPQTSIESVEIAQAKTNCRRVLPTAVIIRSGGLVLRREPSRTSAKAGVGYAPGERFETTLATQKDSENRIWLEVSAPRAGWIPAGFNNRITNIGYCQ